MNTAHPVPAARAARLQTPPAIVRSTKAIFCLLATCLLFLTACGTEPTAPLMGPDLEPITQFAKGGHPDLAPQCPAQPDWVVTTQEEFFQVIRWNAQPGDVVAIEGLIVTNRGAWTYTEGLTITCASPGSGLVADPGAEWAPGNLGYLFRIYAPNVTVTGLVLDAAAAPDGVIYASNSGVSRLAADLTFTNNAANCGPESCLFFAGVKGSVVTDNHFRANGAGTGIHIQASGEIYPDGTREFPADGTRVLRNTVIMTEPRPGNGDGWWMIMGGIRVRGGEDVTVAHNRVEGPWINTLSFANLRGSVIANNSGWGAQLHGINFHDVPNDLWSLDNVVRNNQIADMEEYGAMVHNACRTTFLGNNFRNPGLGAVAAFAETTGANAFVGNGKTVIDDGNWDCDGDGFVDPNLITGTRRIGSGVKLGPMVGGAAKGGKGAEIR